jgi:dTDP-4-amino-4,6-dideoxygalactose transaminase
MTEMQGAVGLAQLERLGEFTQRRWQLGSRLSERLAGVEGISLQRIRPGSKHSYFLFLFKIDLEELGCVVEEFAEALQREGVPARAHLITGGRPVYLYDIFQRRSAFPSSLYPFRSLDTGVDRSYPPGLCPVAEDAFSRWITLELLENYADQNVDEIAFAIAKVAYHLARRPAVSRNR